MKSMDRKTRFTLIELLVVIAIIAILAAMLLPALKSARERGRTAACIANCKSLGAAFTAYVDAYNGYYPHYYKDGKLWNKHLLEMKVITKATFVCPSLDVGETHPVFQQDYETDGGISYPAYGINNWGVGCGYFQLGGGTPSTTQYARQAPVRYPTRLCLAADVRNAVRQCGSYRFVNDRNNTGHRTDGGYGNIDPRHLKRVNMVMADEHVESIQTKDWPNEYEGLPNIWSGLSTE